MAEQGRNNSLTTTQILKEVKDIYWEYAFSMISKRTDFNKKKSVTTKEKALATFVATSSIVSAAFYVQARLIQILERGCSEFCVNGDNQSNL